jgi:hypothetical protein
VTTPYKFIVTNHDNLSFVSLSVCSPKRQSGVEDQALLVDNQAGAASARTSGPSAHPSPAALAHSTHQRSPPNGTRTKNDRRLRKKKNMASWRTQLYQSTTNRPGMCRLRAPTLQENRILPPAERTFIGFFKSRRKKYNFRHLLLVYFLHA